MLKRELKVLPDAKAYPVLPPDMDYIYFDQNDKLPLKKCSKEFSLVTSWWLAESAFVVYCHPGFARMAFRLAGFEHFRFFQGKGTECMVTWNKRDLIITFRGTELQSMSTLHELKTDLNTKPVDFDKGGKVHRGFLNGLDEIWDGENGIFIFIKEMQYKHPKINIRITGHSLGGALASLCFARVEEAKELYIFGAPRVGDRDFVALFNNRAVFRFEHNRDPIPMVPPNIPSINFNFEDIGELIFIDEVGEMKRSRPELSVDEYKAIVKSSISDHMAKIKTIRPTFVELNDHYKESMANWKKNYKLFKSDTTINVTDHMPIFYSLKIWNAIVSKES